MTHYIQWEIGEIMSKKIFTTLITSVLTTCIVAGVIYTYILTNRNEKSTEEELSASLSIECYSNDIGITANQPLDRVTNDSYVMVEQLSTDSYTTKYNEYVEQGLLADVTSKTIGKTTSSQQDTNMTSTESDTTTKKVEKQSTTKSTEKKSTDKATTDKSTTAKKEPETTALPSSTMHLKSKAVAAYNQNLDFIKLVLRYTNEERKRVGVPELQLDEELCIPACHRAVEMIEYGYFSHKRPDKKTSCFTIIEDYKLFYRLLGENIYKGGPTDAKTEQAAYDVVQAWIHSEGHYKTLINPDFTHMAAGIYEDVWVQIFSTKFD